MKKSVYFVISILFVAFLTLNFSGIVIAAENSYEKLVSGYLNEDKWEKSSISLRNELLSKVEDIAPYEMWLSLWDDSVKGEMRAAYALRLVQVLFPDGDLSRWDEIEGMWYPSIIPIPLASIDAAYIAAHELLQMKRMDASWLARNLINDLSRSSRAKYYFMREAPVEYLDIITKLEAMDMGPGFGNWTQPEVTGSLSLASPVRGRISQNAALSRKFVFLNASGVIVNIGTYAWDRENGHIYEVIEREKEGNHVVFIPRW